MVNIEDIDYDNELIQHMLSKNKAPNSQEGSKKRRPRSQSNYEENINIKLFAQNKALRKQDFNEYVKIGQMKEIEIQQLVFKAAESPIKIENHQEFPNKEKDNGILFNKSSSCSQSNDNSILDEYWEDFDYENQIKEEKRKFKFIDLDQIYSVNDKKLELLKQEIFKDFDVENPPVLDYYEQLKKKFKLPSRMLLEYERDWYRKYIKMLKKVNRVLVKRAKEQTRNIARKVVINHSGSARTKFEYDLF